MYSSTYSESQPSAEVSDERNSPAALSPRKNPRTPKYEAVWAPESVWIFGVEKNLLSVPKLEPGIFQLVA